ncbi:hypothetical protein DFJ73DRAFT_161754 [Zopfochytrium polystomum]|nr:hypothetical protein DFJ73DRAFT_161754 [Zopfochytrium polystomum]
MTVRVPTPPTSDIVRKTTDAKLETGPSATEIAEQQALAVVGMWMDSMQKEDPKAKPRLHEAKLKLEARRLTVVREDGNSSDGDDGRKASHPRSITGSEKHVVDNTAEVLYLDPETRMYKNQLIQLARSSSSMSGGTAASAGQSGASPLLRAEQAAPNRSDLAPPSNRPRPKFCDGNARFLMTGLSADDKARIGRQLQELGAQVIVSDSWSDGCTHLLCPKPSMTEKCLAACASGAWLMKPDYVAACANAGRMLEEEDWEWTSADTEGAVEAARFWRKKLGNSRRNFEAPRAGCFEKWTVLLVMSNNRRLLYSRVLKAGGAYVAVETVSTMSKAAAQQSFSHCVTDSDIAKTEGFQDLSRQGVTVSPSSLILDFITKFRQFNPKN